MSDFSPDKTWFDGRNLSTGQMYDLTQTSEQFHDGTVFVCNNGKTVGFLSSAWPVAVYGETGELHNLTKSGAETLKTQLPETFRVMKVLAESFGLGAVELSD